MSEYDLNVLGTICGFITGVATCLLTFFVFRMGEINKKKDSVRKVAFEFVSDFILPFEQLNHNILQYSDSGKNISLEEYLEVCKSFDLRTEFPCWYSLQSEIWGAYKKKKENTSFDAIRKFVEDARKYSKEMSELIRGMEQINHNTNHYDIINTGYQINVQALTEKMQKKIKELPNDMEIRALREAMGLA